MFNLMVDSKHLVAKVLNIKGEMVKQYPKYLITNMETFKVLRNTKHYRSATDSFGSVIPTVCDLRVVIDNDLLYGEVEVR